MTHACVLMLASASESAVTKLSSDCEGGGTLVADQSRLTSVEPNTNFIARRKRSPFAYPMNLGTEAAT